MSNQQKPGQKCESRLRWNVIANYLGSGWAALMNLAFIPLYIKLMGIEAYGLVGAYAALVGILGMLDMGLSATMNREMARLSALPAMGNSARDLARSLELIYWLVAVLIGATVILLAGPMAYHWLNPEQLSREEVQLATVVMGLVIAIRWPISLYSGGLIGLQRQVKLNVITAAAATVRGLGSVIVLLFIAPTIQAFFLFQALANALEMVALRTSLWSALPGSEYRPRFNLDSLRNVRHFAAGMAGIGVLGIILANVDKVVLSKMLSLEEFGYYSLAWAVMSVELRLVYPLGSAIYPRLTQLIALRAENDFKSLYRAASQLVSIIILPITAILVGFSVPVLTLWSGNLTLAQTTGPVLSVLAIGACLNGLCQMPYLTQLAGGRTRLWFSLNFCCLLVLLPLLILTTRLYGPIGAAFMWVALNSAYLLVGSFGALRWVTSEIMRVWYVYDIGLPMFLVCCVAFVGHSVMPSEMAPLGTAAWLGSITVMSVVAAAAATPILGLEVERLIVNTRRTASS